MPDPVTPAADAGAAPEVLTDEQLTAAFPGQDVAHLRSMMAKTDPASAGDASASDSTVEYPDWIPEKFRQGTVEEASQKMSAAYTSLEQTQSGKPDAAAEAAAADTKPDATPANASPFAAAEAEYMANEGVISPETYATLATMGMNKEFVDGHFAGQSAIADQLVTKVHAEAGGEEAYAAMMAWAEANWTPAEIDAYDTVMNQDNAAAVKLAVSGLKAAMVTAQGTNPNLVLGNSDSNGPTGAAYASRSEMTDDMKNPKYKTDPAWRDMVAKKVANSKVW